MSKAIVDKVTKLIEPAVTSLGYEIVRVLLLSSARDGDAQTLQIKTEAEDGTMTVEGCAKISREISVILDVEDPISGEYNLEVSSPGLDRPLTRRKDFVNYAGYEVKVEMEAAIEGRRRFKGELLGLRGDEINILVDGAEYLLPLEEMLKSKLVLTDDLIAKSQAALSGK
jgi:ribosome maturation factor RimP